MRNEIARLKGRDAPVTETETMLNGLALFFVNHLIVAWGIFLACTVIPGMAGSKLVGWKNALVFVVFVLVGGFFVTDAWLTNQRNQAFSASLATAKQISFQTSQGVNDINDLETIRRFGQIVKEGQSVEAHHSHPTNRVRFWFNDHRHTYRLGQDAYTKDEFWLEVEAGDNLNNWLLKQFRSPTMGAWLSENITDYAHAGLQLGPE